ncbi:hypothetical protein [Neobacillus sp. NPDC093127]|uniref:hypothetical protein n=1 Tax=Neobacillus sp. NPDC093127 TaxID=3364296 RepID=UPI0037FDD912
MNLANNEFYLKIQELANIKGYSITITDFISSGENERGLASHYVDYQQRKIIISIPQDHSEKEALFVHELIHAELFLNGYPRILRSPEFKYSEQDNMLADEIENMAHHFLLYPRMRELGYMHSKENDKFLEKVKKEIDIVNKGPAAIEAAFNVLEADYRDYEKFKVLDPSFEKKNPQVYSLYRRFKRLYSISNNPSNMRRAILSVIKEVQNKAKKEAGITLNYNFLFSVPPIPTDYEKEQFCSKFYTIGKIPNTKHHYIFDKRDNQCCNILNGNTYSLQEVQNMLNEKKVKELFN